MNTRFTRFATLLLVLALLIGCAPTAPSGATEAQPGAEPANKAGGTLVIAQPVEPDTLDANLTGGGVLTINLMNAISAPLVTLDPKSGDYVPYLAESWQASADGLTWTFKLKPGVKFHNGDPVTAADWVYSIARSKEAQGGLSGFLLRSVERAEAVDEQTLALILAKPYAALLYSLAVATVTPVSQAAVEAAGDEYGRMPVGVGPFKVKEWVTGSRVLLERNPDFAWGPAHAQTGPPNLEAIEFRILPEAATVLAGLDAGEIDVASVLAKDAQRLVDGGSFQLFQTELTGIPSFVQMKLNEAPFTDLRVRQALNYAVDREALIKVAVQGYGSPMVAPLTPADIGYAAAAHANGYTFDLAKAQALMSEAGYEDRDGDGIREGSDGQALQFTIKTTPDPEVVRTAEVLKEQFKALGWELTIEQMEAGAFYGEVCSPEPPSLAVMGMSFGELDLLGVYRSDAVGCVGNPQDPDVDALIDLTRTTTDQSERFKVGADLQQMLAEKAYSVWLYAGLNSLVVSNRVKDVIFVPYADSQYGLQWFNAYVE